MTREEYNNWTIKTLSKKELCLVNCNIYSHPKHIEYWENYKMGDYDFCKDYLLANRGELDEPRGFEEEDNKVARVMMERMGVK